LNPTIIFAVLGAAILHASWNMLVKKSPDKLTGVMQVMIGSTLCGIGCIYFLPAIKPESYPFILGSGVIHVAYCLLMAFVYRTAHMSVTYPITRGAAPLITSMITIVVLGEFPGLPAIGAIICLSCGVLWLAWDGVRNEGLDRQSFIAALMMACVIASYTVVDGQGGRLSQSPFVYNGWRDIVTLTLLTPIAAMMRGKPMFREIPRGWKTAAIGGSAGFAAYGIVIWAMSYAPIALVAALRETSVLFGVLLATFVLKERFGRTRYAAVALVLAGLVIIRFS
jgi:drug/metabolite transporter (DMT)-like permease